MLIQIKQELERIQKDRKSNNTIKDTSMKGTLAVIDGLGLYFNKIDHYIQFMKMALDNIIDCHGPQDKEWQALLDRIYEMAEKLQDSRTKFTGRTKEEFREYCEKLSNVLDTEVEEHLKILHLNKETADDLIPFMEEQVSAGNRLGFYYDETEDVHKGLLHDLVKELAGLKLKKTSYREDTLEISYYLTDSHYHEHVPDALNLLIQVAMYAANCSSTRDKAAYAFDIETVNQRLSYIENTIRRVKYVI